MTDRNSSLAALVDRGRAAYPELLVEEAVFEAHLARSGKKTLPELADAAEVFVEDLYLACACAERVAGAAEVFRRRFRQTIRRALNGLSAAPAFCDEVEQHVYESMLLGRHGGPPGIADYAGRGPLARWVTVVSQRAGLAMLRADAAHARARDLAALETVGASVHGEIAYLKRECRLAADEVLMEILQELERRDRVILHLHLVGGAGVKKIGKMYGVNASTVSRWLAQARRQIGEKMQQRLRSRLGLEEHEIDSVLALVMSQLHISVTALLA